MITGAGPAGLEAARFAGERGHEAVVLEEQPAMLAGKRASRRRVSAVVS